MTIDEAMQVVSRGRLEPLYVLAGSNRYWAQAWVQAAKQAFLGPDAAENYMRLDGAQDFKAIELELAARGFFADRKLVVVENGRWAKKEETLSRYLTRPVSDTLLVLVEDKASASLEKAVGSHRYVDLKPLTPVSFKRFVEEAAQARSIRFVKDGLDTFCRVTAGNEYQVVQELEKMVLTGTDAWDGRAVVDHVLPLPSDEPLWDVTDALVKKDAAATLRLVQHHLGRNVPPLVLFIMMVRQVIQIDRARRAQAAGLSAALFQKQEGLRDFVAKKLWSAARRWDDDDIGRLLDWAGRIDVALKTGYGEPDVWVVLWVQLLLAKTAAHDRA